MVELVGFPLVVIDPSFPCRLFAFRLGTQTTAFSPSSNEKTIVKVLSRLDSMYEVKSTLKNSILSTNRMPCHLSKVPTDRTLWAWCLYVPGNEEGPYTLTLLLTPNWIGGQSLVNQVVNQ